ncbi:MAG: LytTR family DNA-binding domain-containing protein [Flavobacteriaceae bacterium]
MMLLNYIIVSPNSLQRLHLSQLLKKIRTLQFKADFSNALEAQNFLNYTPVDLVFLSVDLPVYNGFDFITKLKDPMEIVLLTENPKDALKAFELNLSDCISPPYTLARLENTVARIIENLKLKEQSNSLSEYTIEIKHNLKNEKVNTDKIKWVEAMGDYVKIITESKKYLVLSTMKDFLTKLPEKQFIRVHKSFIINLKKVSHYSASSAHIEGVNIPISRNQKKQFRLSVNKN